MSEQQLPESPRLNGVVATGRPDNATVRAIFHRCWSRATSSPDYDKQDWRALGEVLSRLGYTGV
jgi:hypothetical protein